MRQGRSPVSTRRYHGLLIAALPAPLGRMVMLRHLREQLRFLDGTVVQIGGEERAENDLEMPMANYLTEFRLEWLRPSGATRWERPSSRPDCCSPMQNTVHITYRVVSGQDLYGWSCVHRCTSAGTRTQ